MEIGIVLWQQLLEIGPVLFALIACSLGVRAALVGGQHYLGRSRLYPPGLNLFRHFYAPLQAGLCFLALWLALPFSEPPSRLEHGFITCTRIGVACSFAFCLMRFVNVAGQMLSRREELSSAGPSRRFLTQVRYLERVLDGLIVVVTLSIILLSFQTFRQFGQSLLASAGLAGVVVGFAAQRSLGNLLAGFQLAFTQPVRINDAVHVEGEFGWVEEITLTYVVVRLWDLRRLILPINYFLEKPFQNWTHTSSELLGHILVHVDFSVPVEELRRELTRILEASQHWDGKVQVLQVVETTPTCMVLRALLSAKNPGTSWDLRCEVREKLIHYIQTHYPDALPRLRMSEGDPRSSLPAHPARSLDH